ncbi:MAG: hypothetical protein KDD48_04705 [Bdellovibrionales bacterium]|nr:hypothetical protein [Bdellovibrionales bacterium]
MAGCNEDKPIDQNKTDKSQPTDSGLGKSKEPPKTPPKTLPKNGSIVPGSENANAIEAEPEVPVQGAEKGIEGNTGDQNSTLNDVNNPKIDQNTTEVDQQTLPGEPGATGNASECPDGLTLREVPVVVFAGSQFVQAFKGSWQDKIKQYINDVSALYVENFCISFKVEELTVSNEVKAVDWANPTLESTLKMPELKARHAINIYFEYLTQDQRDGISRINDGKIGRGKATFLGQEMVFIMTDNQNEASIQNALALYMGLLFGSEVLIEENCVMSASGPEDSSNEKLRKFCDGSKDVILANRGRYFDVDHPNVDPGLFSDAAVEALIENQSLFANINGYKDQIIYELIREGHRFEVEQARDEAIRTYLRASKLQVDLAVLYYLVGAQYQNKKDALNALKYYNEALEQDENVYVFFKVHYYSIDILLPTVTSSGEGCEDVRTHIRGCSKYLELLKSNPEEPIKYFAPLNNADLKNYENGLDGYRKFFAAKCIKMGGP